MGKAESTLKRLSGTVKDGTFPEMIDDWKWIFSYSKNYKGAILFYVVIGVISTCTSLVASVASKHVIDIIAGYEYDRLVFMSVLMVGCAVFTMTFNSLVNRLSTKISLRINNEIQADIFDKIIDADWMSLSQFANGDILNRFNGDVSTVAENEKNMRLANEEAWKELYERVYGIPLEYTTIVKAEEAKKPAKDAQKEEK